MHRLSMSRIITLESLDSHLSHLLDAEEVQHEESQSIIIPCFWARHPSFYLLGDRRPQRRSKGRIVRDAREIIGTYTWEEGVSSVSSAYNGTYETLDLHLRPVGLRGREEMPPARIQIFLERDVGVSASRRNDYLRRDLSWRETDLTTTIPTGLLIPDYDG